MKTTNLDNLINMYGLDKLNTMTKYPSILTYHETAERGTLAQNTYENKDFSGYEKVYVTEKIDGTSTTFAIKGYGKKQEFYVCSRNVVQADPDRECYYDSNVYWEMAEKYNIKEKLASFMDPGIEYIILQGETYGAGVQKRDYSLEGHDFAAFNFIVKEENAEPIRFDWYEMKRLLDVVGIPVVPLVDGDFKIPETCDELLEIAEGNSAIDGKMREGIVIRSKDGQRSFKAVSNPFLLKYHG